jgi:hypothetical protein
MGLKISKKNYGLRHVHTSNSANPEMSTEVISELVFKRLEDLSIRLEELIDTVYENSDNKAYEMSKILVSLESFHMKIDQEESLIKKKGS